MNSHAEPGVPSTLKGDATVSSAWTSVLEQARRSPTPSLLLSLDPGETTGWALFKNGELSTCGQFSMTGKQAMNDLMKFLMWTGPEAIVCEAYRVYAHRAKQHVGSEVLTVQYIGVIKLAAETLDVPLTFQMAYQAKAFATDDKLRRWGMYQVARPHANDAIRHAVYYLLFHMVKGDNGTQGRRQGSSL